MNTFEFEYMMSTADKELNDIICMTEASFGRKLSPSGKDIKNKIKDILEDNDTDGITDSAENIIKMKGYDRRIVTAVTREISKLFSNVFHTDVIKKRAAVPFVAGGALSKDIFNQQWVCANNMHVYSFMITYGPNRGVLLGFIEQDPTDYDYPFDIILYAIKNCDKGSVLKFGKKYIQSLGIEGSEAINNALYKKIEYYVSSKHSELKCKQYLGKLQIR